MIHILLLLLVKNTSKNIAAASMSLSCHNFVVISDYVFLEFIYLFCDWPKGR